MLCVFVFLGILSPLTAMLLPQLLGSIDLGDGIILTLPEPSAMDAWLQFFSNIGQLGMLVVIIMFSGIMANEFSRQTLVILLTKGLSRMAIILSKFIAASLVWSLAFLLSLAITAAYVAFYWEINILNGLFAFFSLWLFGELLISLLIFGGTLFASFYGALALAGASIITLALISIVPDLQRFNPLSLSGGTVVLLNGTQHTEFFMPAILICLVAIITLIAASIVVFKRKHI